MAAKFAQHSLRYEKEYEILVEISAQLVKITSEAVDLRPAWAMNERRNERSELGELRARVLRQSIVSLDNFSKVNRPFFCPEVYDATDRLLNHVDRELEYCIASSATYARSELIWYEAGAIEAAKTRDLSNDAREAIRKRTIEWYRIGTAA